MTDNAKLESVLREWAARQHGLVTRAQLLSAGIAVHVIERRVRSGRLLKLYRGVYRADAATRPGQRELAALLACGLDCRVSHRTAAGLWKLSNGAPDNPGVEVTMHRRKRHRIPGIRVHRVSDLRQDEVTVIDGIAITTPARTLLDLAECVRPRELENALARAERSGLVTKDDLRAMVKRHPRHRGAAVLRKLLESDDPAVLTRSSAEELFAELVRKACLPTAEVNARVLRHEVDFLWRGPRLIVEIDGFEFHGSAHAFVEDRRRDAELAAAGYRVVRFTWQDLTERRESVIGRLAQALVR
jgi:very-short-patch-repair endonuclease